MVMLLERLLSRCASVVVTIIKVAVIPELRHIANRGEVDVRLLQQLFEIGDPLSAGTDDRHIQAVA